MNKINKILGAAAVTALTMLASCNMDPEERFEKLPPITAERTVLLMDFTGQRCVQCPAAHEIMEGLQEQYGDHLICVSIHGGKMATPVQATNFEKNNIGLMIKEGNEMNNAFGIEAWPMGVVDRINDSGAALLSSEWATAVRSALEQPSDVRIVPEAVINGDNIDVTVDVTSGASRNAALQIWVVEDGIVAQQSFPTSTVHDYVHNNVLRFVEYPLAGNPMTLVSNESQQTKVSIEIKNTNKERWNRQNLSVVAFLFEGTRILNTAKVKISSTEQ